MDTTFDVAPVFATLDAGLTVALMVSALANVTYLSIDSGLEKIAVAVIVLPPVPLFGVAVKAEITMGMRERLAVRESKYLPVIVTLPGCERPGLTPKN